MNAFHRRSWCATTILLLALDPTRAGETERENRPGISRIDLPTVLRLAHARNLDIQIARERLAEAEANRAAAIWQVDLVVWRDQIEARRDGDSHLGR